MNHNMTIKERFLYAIGYKYLANRETHEIHKMSNPVCHTTVHMAQKNRMYLTSKQALNLLKGEYNGCRFCLNKYDKG